jgi:hypothetical protein
LRIDVPLEPEWTSNAAEVLGLLKHWWRYAGEPPVTPATGPAASPGAPEPASPPAPGSGRRPRNRHGLFFSGGIDSFHALLRGERRAHWLVTLIGFDFPLDDGPRAAEVERSTREIAAALGARAVIVRTNMRTHPSLHGVSWDRTHGAVLASVAHLLTGHVDSMGIASSLPGDRDVPWGSHPRLDPLWSSSRMTVVHQGHGDRVERLRSLAHEPLVQRHLRVCWQNRSATGNCSTCAKCVVAMIVFKSCGTLQSFSVFDTGGDVVARIDALRRTPDRIHSLEQVCETTRLEPRFEAAVQRLIARSRRDMSPLVQTRRRIAGAVLGWFGKGRP